MTDFNQSRETSDVYSLRGRVFNKIREDILNGRYQENDELREMAIGDELGVSRTPVREAFRQLELEGLIRIVPNKGAYVTGISEDDVSDIYAIRSLLEGLCAKWATTNISKEQMDEMEEVIMLSEFHLSKGNYEQITELDNRFHMLMYEACESKILIHLLKDFHHYVQKQRHANLSNLERSKDAIEEHKKIMMAIKDHDSELAERLADEHINNAFKSMRENVLHEGK